MIWLVGWLLIRAFDRDGSGNITYSDIQNILEKLGEKLTNDECTAILSQYVDSDGNIQYEKLVHTLMSEESRG